MFASANYSCSQDAKEIRAAKQGTLLQEANGRVFHSIHEIFSRTKMYIRNVCVWIVSSCLYILSKGNLLIGYEMELFQKVYQYHYVNHYEQGDNV